MFKTEIIEFIKGFKTVILSTSNKDVPNSSYAPYALDKDFNFYIHISAQAKHHKNLLNNPNFSIFFIQNEAEAKNVFDRVRVTLFGKAYMIKKEEEVVFAKRLLKERFGSFFDIISRMSDFSTFKLTPKKGLYFRGFGEAFEFMLPTFKYTQIGGSNPYLNIKGGVNE